MYLVKWKGYSSDQNTWEPEINLRTCREVIDEYNENLSKRPIVKHKSSDKRPQPVIKPAKSKESSKESKEISKPKKKVVIA